MSELIAILDRGGKQVEEREHDHSRACCKEQGGYSFKKKGLGLNTGNGTSPGSSA
jgi:hypothetical protein